MEKETKEPMTAEPQEVTAPETQEEKTEQKKVGVCSCDFSFKRTLMILLAMLIGFAIGIGVTWIAFDRLNHPEGGEEIVEVEEEKPEAPKGKVKGKGRAKDPKRATLMTMAQVAKAAMLYKKQFGSFPQFAKDTCPMVDGWGNFLIFKASAGKRPFDLISCGADKKLGTEDDIVWTPRKRGAGKGKGKGKGKEAPKK